MEVTVYILRCSDGSYYTGLTKQEIEARVWEHNAVSYDGYTAKRFAMVESSGRETNCIGFSENTAAPNGQPRTRLYGYLCNVGSGEIEDVKVTSFIAAIDG